MRTNPNFPLFFDNFPLFSPNPSLTFTKEKLFSFHLDRRGVHAWTVTNVNFCFLPHSMKEIHNGKFDCGFRSMECLYYLCDLKVDVNGEEIFIVDKPKRYKNFQNSIQSAPTSQGVAQTLSTTESTPSHFDDAPQLTSFIQPITQPTPSGHVAANPVLLDQTTTQQVPSARVASQHTPSRKCSGRVSTQHWTVDEIGIFLLSVSANFSLVGPSDAASGSISPMDIRRSSGGSNPNNNL
ncbi:hypothetical protein A4A49_52036 [Nicotiana attenuata]|uniref:Uncharacterized protein n=1 Tax=Nicotiana attenuata TaxID=49451 RepID=A0A314L9P2_NICAT|nr:hypothetical protein A4A49_52036 [Nicotiana attenuata]